MSIQLSDNIRVGQQLPLESKYFNGTVPYTDVAQAESLITIGLRHRGLTVNIAGVEYWFKDGINNGDLVEKTGGGGVNRDISSINTNTTAGNDADTDYIYFASGTITITLPTAVSNTNQYTIKRVGTGDITIAAAGSETIDGSSSIQLKVQNQSVDIISNNDGTNANWNII
jgi:hypothetical protein